MQTRIVFNEGFAGQKQGCEKHTSPAEQSAFVWQPTEHPTQSLVGGVGVQRYPPVQS
jgi:hypothetical protein